MEHQIFSLLALATSNGHHISKCLNSSSRVLF